MIFWSYLAAAALFEIGWPYGLKMLSLSSRPFLWIIFSIGAMVLSGIFLYLAQKGIPIGTAYAVWTGIGAAGTFCLGVLVFGDTLTLLRLLGVCLIIAGVVLLKLGQ